MVASQPLKNREEKILSSVIRHYVETAKPVGSQVIAQSMDLSSATVRNVLLELENKGYLTHPHTSAGRIPLDLAYRFYVDRLMQARSLNVREKQLIEQEYEKTKDEVENLMRHTAKILAAMTRLAGLAVYHTPQEISLDHVKLIAIDSRKVMVLLVLGNGLLKEELVHLDAPVKLKEVARIGQLLNSRFKGMGLVEIRGALLKEAESVKNARLDILEAALKLIDGALRYEYDQIHLEGASRLMEQPEFRNVEMMEKVLRLVEEKEPLAQCFNRSWNRTGLSVEIGRELSEQSLRGFSFVHLPYTLKGRVVGAVGVLGPTRMAYDRVAGIVDHLAKFLEDTFSRRDW